MFKKIALASGLLLSLTSISQSETYFSAFVPVNINSIDYNFNLAKAFPGIKVDLNSQPKMQFYVASDLNFQTKKMNYSLTVYHGVGWCEHQPNSYAKYKVPIKCNAKIGYTKNETQVYEDIENVCIFDEGGVANATGTILKVDNKGSEITVEIMQAEEYDFADGCIKGFTYNFDTGSLKYH